MNKKEKLWVNPWICNPRYEKVIPRQMLHRQLDRDFSLGEHREDLKNNHTLFRKKVWIQPGSKKVFLDISADDYYKLYINGTYVTQGPANSYPFCYYYNRVDITAAVKPGENVLCVHVFYQGLVNRAFNSGDYRQGMIAEVWADGRQLLDYKWKCAEAREYGYSHTSGYDTQFDEIIDNRKKHVGWKELTYDDSWWKMAVVKEEDDHVLILQETPNVQMELRYPQEVKRTEYGYLLDFGEELTGTFGMRAWGLGGSQVRIRFGEELLPSGRVRYELRCNCRYEDKLILAQGENQLEAFDYKCFRYVEILPEDDTIRLEGFQVYFRHYPFDENFCKFSFSDPLLRSIWRICKNAVKNCVQESFLDCPQREKGQYLGDLTVTAHALFYLTGDTTLFKKALEDFAHSTTICPGMMAVAPGSFMQEIADFSLLFPYQLLLYARLTQKREEETMSCTESQYSQSIREFLQEMLPVAEGIDHYFTQFENQQGLLENVKTKWNLVDWPENLRDGYDFDLSQPVAGDGCHNVINALYIGMKECIEKIKDILEIPRHSRTKELKTAFLQAFYCWETGLFVDSTVSRHSSLHANVYASFYGLEPEGNRIAALIQKKGLCCGVFTAYFALYGLLSMGERDLAMELITNQTEYSWYHMLEEGATTAYETWGKDQKWNTSLCHAWAAAPIPVLAEYFASVGDSACPDQCADRLLDIRFGEDFLSNQ